MKDEQRLIEVMAELLAEVHEMRLEVKGMRGDFNNKIDGLGKKVEKLEKEQIKTNLSIQELRLSVLKLADRDKITFDQDRRLGKVERILIKNNIK